MNVFLWLVLPVSQKGPVVLWDPVVTEVVLMVIQTITEVLSRGLLGSSVEVHFIRIK